MCISQFLKHCFNQRLKELRRRETGEGGREGGNKGEMEAEACGSRVGFLFVETALYYL